MGEATPHTRNPRADDPSLSVTDPGGLSPTTGPGATRGESTAEGVVTDSFDPTATTDPGSSARPRDDDGFVLQSDLRSGDGPWSSRDEPASTQGAGDSPTPRSADPSETVVLDVRAASPAAERSVPSIDGYEILDELGRGGMGVVYRARQVLLNRTCVIKMILAGVHADSEAVVRFLAEAEAIARLQHPNVVQIRHIGEAGGLPFFELEYVEGGSLDRRLDGTPWAPRLAAELLEALARGVAEAHRLGIVHRDLKPANILLAADGSPRVTDFGLAKSQATDSGLTRTDWIMGSPQYMAPEQASGRTREVGTAADVYAIGTIFYELLTGRPPFRAATVLETLDLVKNAEPVAPSKLQPGLPRDLETICLECLQKDPARRYASAGELVADLERWRAGAPISARPIPAWEHGWRWARRRPAVAALSASIVLISAVSFALVAWLWARAEDRADAATVARDRADRLAQQEFEARRTAQTERTRAVDSLYRAQVREAAALRLARKTGYRMQVHDLIRQALASDARSRDIEELRREAVACMGDFAGSEPVRWSDLPPEVVVSAIAVAPDSSGVALGLSDASISLRGLPRGGEHARLRGHGAPVCDGRFTADGRRLVSADTVGTIAVWDTGRDGAWSRTRTFATDRPTPGYRLARPVALAVTPDGKTLAVCSGLATSISLWNLADGAPSGRLAVPGREQVTCLAVSADGKQLAAGYRGANQHGALIWDLATRRVERSVAPGLELVLGVAFSPGGRWLACACSEGMALFDASTIQRRLFVRGDLPTAVAFSPDDQVLAIPVEKLGALRLWDVGVNREIAVLDCPKAGGAVAFSPDGHYLIASSDRGARVWTPWTTQEKLTLPGHVGGIPGISSNRAGTLLASAGKDRTVRVWETASGRLAKVLADFDGPVQAVAFGATGSRLIAAEFQGGLRTWNTATWASEPLPDPELTRPVWSINFTGDGQWLWAQASPQAAIWRVAPGGPAGDHSPLQVLRVVPETYDACLSPDGRRLASSIRGRLEVLDVTDLRPVFSVPYEHPPGPRHLAFTPDGKRLVSINRRYEIEVRDVESGRTIASLGGNADRSSSSTIAISPDGAFLAEASRSIAIWDLAHSRPLIVLPETRNSIWSLAWIPGRHRLAAGTSDGELVIWDLDRVRSDLAGLGFPD